jgi:ribosomal protein L11 methylase PrmA
MRLRKSLVGCCATALIGSVLVLAQNAQPKKPLDVPYVPTTDEAVDAMLKLAEVKTTDVVYDLGCGDGRIVIAAAKRYGAHGVGIDIDPQRIAEANANARRAGVEKLVRFEENDLFQANFKDATVVTLFLLSSVNLKLRPKLLAELKPGTRIVSNTFDMGDWKAEKEYSVPNTDDDTFLSHRLYLWTVPGK